MLVGDARHVFLSGAARLADVAVVPLDQPTGSADWDISNPTRNRGFSTCPGSPADSAGWPPQSRMPIYARRSSRWTPQAKPRHCNVARDGKPDRSLLRCRWRGCPATTAAGVTNQNSAENSRRSQDRWKSQSGRGSSKSCPPQKRSSG